MEPIVLQNMMQKQSFITVYIIVTVKPISSHALFA